MSIPGPIVTLFFAVRLLCRRLRKRYPQLPIVVGYWDGSTSDANRPPLAAKDDAEIVTTLAEAVERARAIASRLTPATERTSATSSDAASSQIKPRTREAV